MIGVSNCCTFEAMPINGFENGVHAISNLNEQKAPMQHLPGIDKVKIETNKLIILKSAYCNRISNGSYEYC